MTTITIDSALLEQALDALTCSGDNDDPGHRCSHCDDYVDRNSVVRQALRAALAAQQPAPAWHDAPTEPGDWILSTACGLEVHQGIKQHELDNGELWPGSRWFGPIPEYQK